VTQQHPAWCVVAFCTATGHSGAHRSQPISPDPSVGVRANLFALSTAPTEVFVEIRCGQAILPAPVAYALGRLLISFAKLERGD